MASATSLRMRVPPLSSYGHGNNVREEPDDDETQDREPGIGVRGKCLLARAASIDGALAEIRSWPGRAPVGDDRDDVGSFQMWGHRDQRMAGERMRSRSFGRKRPAHLAEVPAEATSMPFELSDRPGGSA